MATLRPDIARIRRDFAELANIYAEQGRREATPELWEVWNRLGTQARAVWWSKYWQKNHEGWKSTGNPFMRRQAYPPDSPPPGASIRPGRYDYLTEEEAAKSLRRRYNDSEF